ncbi:MAG TPA: Uma2 family endonuclease [Planctomycetota bacterium]|nr:Uma2 family endonuclease [Planctomycetota bacterium]
MGAVTKQWTEAELMALPRDGRKREFISGEIVVSPAGGFLHGDVAVAIASLLYAHVRARKLGYVFDGQTGFWMMSGNLLSPDVSFVAQSRFSGDERPTGFLHGAPDLAVEILSPSQSQKELDEKCRELLANGSRLVWIVSPLERSVRVLSREAAEQIRGERDTIDGGAVLPEFSVPVSDFFPAR